MSLFFCPPFLITCRFSQVKKMIFGSNMMQKIGLILRTHSAPVLRYLALVAASILPLAAFAQEAPHVRFITSAGEIVIELYPDKAPKTVDNFIGYVKSGHYSGTIFHRVIGRFIIQGGGLDRNMIEKPTRAPVSLEANNGLRNDRGTIAMARRIDPNSATAQFFINLVDNPTLNSPKPDGYGYAVFGRVVSGMDVVDRIGAVATKYVGPFGDVPVNPITITSIILDKQSVQTREPSLSGAPSVGKPGQVSGKAVGAKPATAGDSFPGVRQ